MKLSEYQELAARTCAELPFEDHLLHMQLGKLTELGELLDIFKKNLAYGKELDKVHIGEEIADFMWYTANDANLYKLNLDTLYIKDYTFKSESDVIKTLMQLVSLISSGDYEESYPISVMKGVAKFFDLGFERLLVNNIDKLRVRFKDKFSSEEALNRDLSAERAELEK